MQANCPNRDMAELEEGLQDLFRSLSQEWDDALKAKKKEKLDAFMGKWVEGVSNLFADKDIMSGKEGRQDHLPRRGLNHPSAEQSEKQTSLTSISPSETETIMRMIEKLHRDAQRSETESNTPLLSLLLEVKADKDVKSLTIPVSLKNLYQEMVILEVSNFKGIKDPQNLQKKKASLRLTDRENRESMNIDGVLTWAPPAFGGKNEINLSIDKHKNKDASIILEKLLPHASKAHLLLWNMYDEMKVTQGKPTDQKSNFILLLLACGTIASSFMEPKLFQSMQYVLSALSLGKVFKFIKKR